RTARGLTVWAMLRYLLDEHISPIVADRVSEKYPDISVISIYRWRDGHHQGDNDEELLSAAAEGSLTLVTYDRKTVPNVLCEWADSERTHACVVFVDHLTISPNDFGSLMRALCSHWRRYGQIDWTNRIGFLERANPYIHEK